MTQSLLASCLEFADGVDLYPTPRDVVLAWDKAVRPTMRVYGVWPIPVKTLRGNRDPYPTHIHPDIEPFLREFWQRFKINGPSILARYAWQHHRDFSLQDVISLHGIKPTDIWIFHLLHEHGIRDVKYIAMFKSWYGVYWSPKKAVQLTKQQWRGLRLAAEAAAERIEQLGHLKDLNPGLSDRERDVLRMLRDDLTERQVAYVLGVTLASVKAYVKRAKIKLGTGGLRDTIAEAVRRYVVLGLTIGLGTGGILEAYDIHWWD